MSSSSSERAISSRPFALKTLHPQAPAWWWGLDVLLLCEAASLPLNVSGQETRGAVRLWHAAEAGSRSAASAGSVGGPQSVPHTMQGGGHRGVSQEVRKQSEKEYELGEMHVTLYLLEPPTQDFCWAGDTTGFSKPTGIWKHSSPSHEKLSCGSQMTQVLVSTWTITWLLGSQLLHL